MTKATIFNGIANKANFEYLLTGVDKGQQGTTLMTMNFGFNLATACRFLGPLLGQTICSNQPDPICHGNLVSSQVISPQNPISEYHGKTSFSSEKYPTGGVPLKFDTHGTVQPFAGNTILCHLPHNSSLQKPLQGLYKDIQNSSISKYYALLPPSSYHMTVFEGICDQIRKPESWPSPSDLPLNATLDKCNEFFRDCLADFSLGFDLPIRMSVHGFRGLEHGISLNLTTVDDAGESQMRDLRDRLSKTTGLRQRGHDKYGFHLSIAYLVQNITDKEAKTVLNIFKKWQEKLPATIKLWAPEFCTFKNMSVFEPQCLIDGSFCRPTKQIQN